MAVTNRAGQSSQSDKPYLASLNPDEMVQGGLPDDFDGWMRVYMVPWTYPDGTIPHYMLAGRVDYMPDAESGLSPFSEYYGCGNKSLVDFVPSTDGVNPAGASFEEYAALASGEAQIDKGSEENMKGVYTLRMPGSRVEGLNNNSKFNEFVDAVKEIINSASPALLKSAGWMGWNPSSECLTLYGHFNRVAGRERGGLQRAEGKRKPQILVMTELKAAPSGKPEATVSQSAAGTSQAQVSSPAAASAQAAPSPAAVASANGDLDARLGAVVLELLAENDGSLPKQKLPALVMKRFDGVERGQAIRRVSEPAFLSASSDWAFDASTGTVSFPS